MVSAETTRLLRWHAGLDGDPLDPRSVSGSVAAGRDVERAVRDLNDAMEVLNREMNGDQPSASVGRQMDDVPRDVAYAVAEVARMLGDAAHVIEAWTVHTAWNAVLAGDVGDLANQIDLEREARAPGPNKPLA